MMLNIETIFNIINVFTVIFDQIIASLLNRSSLLILCKKIFCDDARDNAAICDP